MLRVSFWVAPRDRIKKGMLLNGFGLSIPNPMRTQHVLFLLVGLTNVNGFAINKPSRTDLARLNALDDDAIDYSNIPPLDDSFFARARIRLPKQPAKMYIPIDQAILRWFDSHSDQPSVDAINQILRQHIGVE